MKNTQKKMQFVILFLLLISGVNMNAQNCAQINDIPIFHLYDESSSSATNRLDLYKQRSMGGTFVCPDTQCGINPIGALYKRTNITGNIDNLAYDDGKYFTITSAGDLLYTDNIILGNFTNLGNAQIGSGFKNLAYDNGIFYHWKYASNQLRLYKSLDPVVIGWSLMGTVIDRPVSFIDDEYGIHNYELKDIAVNDGIFYFMYYSDDACITCNFVRTFVYSSAAPISSSPNWQNMGSTYFGNGVLNIAAGSQDLKALAPPVKNISNICPATTANLATAHTGMTPDGSSLFWFTNSTHTGTALSGTQITQAGAGTYYAFYYDDTNNCYSPAAPVTVTINTCIPINNCVTGDCNDNTFLNTSNPNTLEYDNLISGFHSSIAKQDDGNYLIWGQGTKPNTFGEHLYEPTTITPANGFNYTGNILKAALGTRGATNLGSDQYALLTTDGLFLWGAGDSFDSRKDVMVHRSVKDSQTFDKMTATNIPNANTYGLPVGVNPEDVKMFFGSYGTLALTTCTGEAYVLSWRGSKNGDGTPDTAANYNIWHRVMINATTPLNGVVAMRGNPNALVALTQNGKLYTWGTDTYLGDGSDKANRLFATQMTLPDGITPKMIGMTKATSYIYSTLNSYYVLSTTGEVYSLGDNSKKQLGTFDIAEKKVWVNVKSTNASTNMTDIVWFSPNEHDAAGHAVVTALTSDGKLWGWGMNNGNMLGSGANGSVDPRYMFGELSHDEKILAIETGGHINTLFKDCDFKLGYIGHSSNGSYAIYASSNGSNFADFKFDGARLSNLCAIYTPPYPEVEDLKMCAGNTVDLANALLSTTPDGYTLEWWTTTTRTPGTQVINTTAVGAGTYYAFYISSTSVCAAADSTVIVSYYTVTDPEYATCICFRDPVTTGTAQDTKMGITLLKRAGTNDTDHWPMVRKSGHVALESNTQGFVITRIAKADLGNITSPQEGMMVYDTTDKCLKLYSNGVWSCFNTPTCP